MNLRFDFFELKTKTEAEENGTRYNSPFFDKKSLLGYNPNKLFLKLRYCVS